MSPLTADEVARVRQTQTVLRAVRRCPSCGTLRPVVDYRDFAAERCKPCEDDEG